MKKYYLTIGILVAANFIITLILISFMPDEIPAHFDLSGEVNRIGSRYEILIMPLMGVVLGLLLLLIVRFGDHEEAKTLRRASILTQLVLIVISVAWALTILFSEGDQIGFVFEKTNAVVLGILLLLVGNAMPKTNINAIYGIRTHWSMSNDEVWQKTQRFGGYASIVAGLVLFVCGIVLDGFYLGGLVFGVVLIWGLTCLIASYKIYKDSLVDL